MVKLLQQYERIKLAKLFGNIIFSKDIGGAAASYSNSPVELKMLTDNIEVHHGNC